MVSCIHQIHLEFIFMNHYAPNRFEPSIEVIMKMGIQWGCQGGCERERRIEVIVKIKKKSGKGGQVRVDVNEELKFL